jgi:hypothetical protein
MSEFSFVLCYAVAADVGLTAMCVTLFSGKPDVIFVHLDLLPFMAQRSLRRDVTAERGNRILGYLLGFH